jgi:hypothetical protein
MPAHRFANVDAVEIAPPEAALRIPGVWQRPEEFAERLPAGCRMTESGLVLADGTEFELHPLAADDEFPRLFATSCAKLPTADERERIESYVTNLCIVGPGGSIDAATRIMNAAAVVLHAGGAGVFVDNSGLAHGATDWLTLVESANDGGVYWAFVSYVRGERELYSIGMHVLGCRDAIIPRTGNDEYDLRTLHSFLGYSAFSGAELHDGEVVGDAVLPTFKIRSQADDRVPSSAPMFNPYGRWRLETLDGERN